MKTTNKTYTHTVLAIDGREVTTTNAYSCGPGCTPHTFDLPGGDSVYEIGDKWTLRSPGQWPREVSVKVVRRGGWF